MGGLPYCSIIGTWALAKCSDVECSAVVGLKNGLSLSIEQAEPADHEKPLSITSHCGKFLFQSVLTTSLAQCD